LLWYGAARMSLMPGVVLAAESCPRGIGMEASMFSLFSASAHFAQLVSAAVSAQITVALGIFRQFIPLYHIISCHVMSCHHASLLS
jgi:hypothetical protein